MLREKKRQLTRELKKAFDPNSDTSQGLIGKKEVN
jgi:hypothetical protein